MRLVVFWKDLLKGEEADGEMMRWKNRRLFSYSLIYSERSSRLQNVFNIACWDRGIFRLEANRWI